MFWTSLLSLAALAEAAPQFGGGFGGVTMLRFGCPNVVIDRLDPLVNPGSIPSSHVHQIVGGNAFNASMTTGDVSKAATCTTCQFSEDFSNYWTANLYFKARNGSYKRVPQLGHALQFNDQFSTQTQGGILVYYVSAQPGQITAFKPGFRMLSGDAMARSRSDTKLKRQNCFRCYTGPNYGGDVGAPCMDDNVDSEALPNKVCPGGIRSNILFPTCWDGKNLDSPNHQDHVTYPTTGPANFLSLGGSCPSTHPVRIPQLMYEVVWDTTKFNDKSQWPEDGSQPFYLSTGDNTGYGQHADYVFGWKDDSLQKAMDTSGCMGARCATLQTQNINTARECSVKKVVSEDEDGWLPELPGINMPMV
ncbi:uncharacterized protein GGS25DRAFT_244854 [Hypoxylon fragiforme]|uniref:uncharacterized protein n=1 Tax=Hypoxylon fragiforme TaxID=63214 RepID=UPI0020C5C327|nr:uncharacterized protein GGS25DRAFT_244854 [Hypoxylon fragiforme]KAI2610082.1 hypothetical protein GGS25DRAFT_244854 [Hypoxylon fragiforme]